MNIDYFMRPGIKKLQGYVKKKSGESTFIIHENSNKIVFIINDKRKVFRVKDLKEIKSKTYDSIETYLLSKGYGEI